MGSTEIQPLPARQGKRLAAVAVEPIAVDAAGAAAMFGFGKSTWWKMRSKGLTPMPVRIGCRLTVWDVEELRAWFRAGAPPRDRWEALKRTAGRSKSR